MSLINEYKQNNDPRFQNTLQVPKVVVPNITPSQEQTQQEQQIVDAKPVQLPDQLTQDEFNKQQPTTHELDQNVDVNQLVNERLATQYPTLTYGASLSDDDQTNEFSRWLDTTIKQEYANSLSRQAAIQNIPPAPNATTGGFSQDSLQRPNAPFVEQDYMNDGIYGNEFDITKGRFGHKGQGWLGAIFYGLNIINPTEYAKTGIMDFTSVAALTGISAWDSAKALWRRQDPVAAFGNRFTDLYNKVFPGGQMYTGQMLRGRDLGFMGAYMTGSEDDDYTKMYGVNPASQSFDKLFSIDKQTVENLTEFSQLSLARNTFASEVPIFGAAIPKGYYELPHASWLPKPFRVFDKPQSLPPELEARYQELLAQQDQTTMARFLARQGIAAVFDIFVDPDKLIGRLMTPKTPSVPDAPITQSTALSTQRATTSPAITSTDLVSIDNPNQRAVSTERVVPNSASSSSTNGSPQTPISDFVWTPEQLGTAIKNVTDPAALDWFKKQYNAAQIELPNTIDDVPDAPVVIRMSPVIEADPVVSSTKNKPRSVVVTELLPDVWDEPLPIVSTPKNETVRRTVQERLALPPAKPQQITSDIWDEPAMSSPLATPIQIQSPASVYILPPSRMPEPIRGDVWDEPSTMSPLASPIETRQPEPQRLLPGTAETNTSQQEITWTPINNRTRVTVEESSDGAMIRRTFNSQSAANNEVEAINVLRGTDLIPEVVESTPSAVTYKRIEGVPLEGVDLFPEMIQLFGQRVKELHGKGIVHEDLHLGNALFDGENIRFIDFENATRLDTLDETQGTKAVQGELGFIRDELEMKGGQALVDAFDRGYGLSPTKKVETGLTTPGVSQKPARKKIHPKVRQAVQGGVAEPIDNGQIRVTQPESSVAKQLEEQAVDLTVLNGEYDIREIPILLSRANALPGRFTFNGKVGEANLVPRTVNQILRIGSLIPNPEDPTKPLIPPSTAIVEAFQQQYGVPHPYAQYARSRVPTKGKIEDVVNTMKGGDRHKSIAHLAVEYGNNYGSFYQKLLDPSGNGIPDQVIEALEKGAASGQGIIIKTGRDTYAVMKQPETTQSKPVQSKKPTRKTPKTTEDIPSIEEISSELDSLLTNVETGKVTKSTTTTKTKSPHIVATPADTIKHSQVQVSPELSKQFAQSNGQPLITPVYVVETSRDVYSAVTPRGDELLSATSADGNQYIMTLVIPNDDVHINLAKLLDVPDDNQQLFFKETTRPKSTTSNYNARMYVDIEDVKPSSVLTYSKTSQDVKDVAKSVIDSGIEIELPVSVLVREVGNDAYEVVGNQFAYDVIKEAGLRKVSVHIVEDTNSVPKRTVNQEPIRDLLTNKLKEVATQGEDATLTRTPTQDDVADVIIQEEKLRTAIANVEEARKEIEAQVDC